MKTLMILAACLSWNAGAATVVVGDPIPCDPSGYPVMTNDLEKAVLMLQDRVSRLEAWASACALEKAKAEEEKAARDRARKERAREENERRRANMEFNRWLADQRERYGRMTLIDYDTNTCERVYRRMDGVTVRKRCYDGAGARARKGGRR